MITPVAIIITPKTMETIDTLVKMGSKLFTLDTQYTKAAIIIKINPTHFIPPNVNSPFFLPKALYVLHD